MVSLPDDLWFHIASTYLHKADTSRLSQTCWQIRFVTLPLVFRRLIFTSSSRYWKSYQLKQQLIHVLDQQRCVHLCSQTRLIFTSIRHIELHNWATTQLRYAHIYPSDLNTQSPGSNEALLSSQDYRVKSAELDVRCRWFATYEMIVKLINILPNLRSITFYEAFNNEEFMPKRRYVPFDEPSWVDNESDWSYSMLEFAVPPSSLGTRRVSVPSIIVSHLHSDPSKACKIREAYFTELLTRCSLPLHSLRLVSKFILNLPIRIYSRFNTLQRLAIVGCVDGPEKELWKTHFPIIMKRSSNLRHLDLWPEYGGTRGIEGIELLNLPMLEVVKLYASEIVRISDTPSITRLNMAYFHSWDLQPKSTPPITHICRVDFWCPDTAEKISNKLGMASNLFPNLQQLALTVSVNNDVSTFQVSREIFIQISPCLTDPEEYI